MDVDLIAKLSTNGIKYVFLEWLDLKQTNLLFFYSLGC